MIYQPEPPRRSNMPYWKKVLPVVLIFVLAVGVIGYRIHEKSARLKKLRADNYWEAQDFIDHRLPVLLSLPQYQNCSMKVVANDADESDLICWVEVRAALQSGEWDQEAILALKQQVAPNIPVDSHLHIRYVLVTKSP